MADKATFDEIHQAFNAVHPGTGQAVTKAKQAGVPLRTILQWLQQHGAGIGGKIDELIQARKK